MRIYRGEYSSKHPKFSSGSPAECGPAKGPVDINAPNFVYSKEDDEVIDRFNREILSTSWHSVRLQLIVSIRGLISVSLQMGTCAMKLRETGGVVDSRLNVYGTRSLKVAGRPLTPRGTLTEAIF